MPFFDHYPYTNLHNVNLDWVLQKVKEWGAMVEDNNQRFEDLQTAYNAFRDWLTADYNNFKDYVTTYLDNLDVQQEINNKLDAMLQSGELVPYLQPYIITTVTEWLDENITPTTPPVDATLSIGGAAADAAVTGNRIDAIETDTNNMERDLSTIASVIPSTSIDVTTLSLVTDKYWGNGGLIPVQSPEGKKYYAVENTITVNPNTQYKLENFGIYSGSLNSGFVGMYDSSYNDAPGRVNFNNSQYVVSYDISTNIDWIIFRTSETCTKIGLYFMIPSNTIPSQLSPKPLFTDPTSGSVIFSKLSLKAINAASETLIKDSNIDRANYFQKGAAYKLDRTKKLCIIGAGQSNIDGRCPVSDLPAGLTLPLTGMEYIKNNLTGIFSNAFPSGPWSFDLILCNALINNLGSDNLYYIKWSQGSTSIDVTGDGLQHWTADYESLSASNALLLQYNKEIEMCNKMNPDDYEIGAMIWHQGEGDVSSSTAVSNYYNNFKKVIAFCRGITGNKCLPFICGTISQYSAQYNETIDLAIRKLASEDPYMYIVDMHNAQLQDSWHFNAAWSIYFGQKVYDCLIDAHVITGTKIDPSEPV